MHTDGPYRDPKTLQLENDSLKTQNTHLSNEIAKLRNAKPRQKWRIPMLEGDGAQAVSMTILVMLIVTTIFTIFAYAIGGFCVATQRGVTLLGILIAVYCLLFVRRVPKSS